MPDDNQTTMQDAEQVANEALENSATPKVDIPGNTDVEYATPSAYIDPDLPSFKPEEKPIEEPKEEEPEEDVLEMTPEQIEEMMKASHATMNKVAEKIANSRNTLIATSSDPSVDELSSAIALAKFLDRLGKHAIAIYSGEAPNALAFLNPAEYFENNADVLQDFVISLNKDKADHLRYKIEDDFVRVFITPYKDRIVANDLEFTYGDYNVDLVLALNVDNGIDLDPALREYGTIMHDATVINITTGNPGKFGEIEWNNKRASSVSEMIADLLCNASGDVKLEPEEATALLTGIVASTDRFSHANTFSTTMQIASRLIELGANPETVAENVTDDVDNQFFAFSDLKPKEKKEEDEGSSNSVSFSFKPTEEIKSKIDPNDDTALSIEHEEEELPEVKEEPKEEVTEPAEEPKKEEPKEEDSALLNELKATEASLSNAGAETVPAPEAAPEPTTISTTAPTIEPLAPSNDFPTNKYSQMLEDALAEPTNTEAAPMESGLPPVQNPAATVAPEVTPAPEVNDMPEINYGQNSDPLLPPPPMPPVDINQSMPLPTPGNVAPAPAPAEPQTPAAGAPDAFTIPGM